MTHPEDPVYDLHRAPLGLRLEAVVRDPNLLTARRMHPLSPHLAGWMQVPEPEHAQVVRAVRAALTIGMPTFATEDIAVIEVNGEPFIRLLNETHSLRWVPPAHLVGLAEALLALAHRLTPTDAPHVLQEGL